MFFETNFLTFIANESHRFSLDDQPLSISLPFMTSQKKNKKLWHSKKAIEYNLKNHQEILNAFGSTLSAYP
jgi:hypothetical protein